MLIYFALDSSTWTTVLHFPMHKTQCQNSTNILAENTTNASENFSPICLPKPKSFEFLKKKLSWGVRSPCSKVSYFWRRFFKHFHGQNRTNKKLDPYWPIDFGLSNFMCVRVMTKMNINKALLLGILNIEFWFWKDLCDKAWFFGTSAIQQINQNFDLRGREGIY